jgi:hypothetical protein
LTAVLRHFNRAVSVLFVWFGLEVGFAPSPLRGEGWDEEWFKITLNLANLTPALSLKRRGSN